MKLTKTKLKQLIKEEIGRTMIEGDEGEKLTFGQLASEWEKRGEDDGPTREMQSRKKLGDTIRPLQSLKVFWYETADGDMLSKDDPRLDEDDVEEVSGVITKIFRLNIDEGPGPYVLVTHDGGTVEINHEWFDSVYTR